MSGTRSWAHRSILSEDCSSRLSLLSLSLGLALSLQVHINRKAFPADTKVANVAGKVIQKRHKHDLHLSNVIMDQLGDKAWSPEDLDRVSDLDAKRQNCHYYSTKEANEKDKVSR